MTASARRPRSSVSEPLRLLGGLAPSEFLHRYWQHRPYLVRGAVAGFRPVLARPELFALAARDDVESRLVTGPSRGRWTLAHGPLPRRALPPLSKPRWTLLVQGVDLHADAAQALLGQFRFVPDARLDDLMISWASLGGGVGPHVDSYDVFLLQANGRRRWRIGRQKSVEFDARAPLKILQRFTPSAEYVLEPGDLLYLPPQWAHEGVALDGDCMTYSIGMRAPTRAGLAGEIATRLSESFADATLYRDRGASAGSPAAIPAALARFAAAAVRQLAGRPDAVAKALGEVLSEPKPHVWFEQCRAVRPSTAVALDRRTRMLYDATHVFVNGEAVHVSGRDAALLRELADGRRLDAPAVRRASSRVRALLTQWSRAGWLHGTKTNGRRR